MSAAEVRDDDLDWSSSSMRRVNGKVVPVRPCKVKGVVDPAPADVGGSKAFGHIIAASRLDIVHHQVEGSREAGFRRLFPLSYDNVCAAAELEHGEVGVLENRA